jgi:hypothetical protein
LKEYNKKSQYISGTNVTIAVRSQNSATAIISISDILTAEYKILNIH